MKRSSFKPSGVAMKRTSFLRAKVREDRDAGKIVRAMKTGKVAPNAAERAWMASVAALGCIVCRRLGFGFVPCAVHHIVEGNRRLGHLYTIGLCDPGHHQNSPDPQQISRHPNKARFVAAYGTEYELLEITQKIISGESHA